MTTPAEKVRVSVAMNPPILLLDYSHQVTLSGTAVVRVEAPSSTKKNHAPIDLIMLINISNSMSWPAASSPTTETPSTRLDLLKKAMKFMSRQLDDGDRLAIVAFNDQVVKEHSTGLLEMSGSGRMAIEKKVDGLVANDSVLQAVAASSLGKKWAEFKKSDESWKQAPGNLLDLGGIDGDMDAVVGALKRGSGVGCAYSWLSSHQMQRATTATGLPPLPAADHVGPFRTPAMTAMVREAHKQMAEEASAQEAGTWVVGKRAAELLDDINKRFELWCKVDHDLPPSHQDEGGESSDLAAGLRGDINRARQHHIYLAADHAIKQWRSFLASVEKTHGHGPDM
ncbi:unnamed protein product [Urochloa decumbens]|uniref:VWFA domain-containing protein n=1 Tax=Urochloa decumbens TaxID=240449 RepID=A0ABC9B703_9POAL